MKKCNLACSINIGAKNPVIVYEHWPDTREFITRTVGIVKYVD